MVKSITTSRSGMLGATHAVLALAFDGTAQQMSHRKAFLQVASRASSTFVSATTSSRHPFSDAKTSQMRNS